MRILVISDTHGNGHRAIAAHTQSEPVDAVIHLGDGCAEADLLRDVLDTPVVNVAGNCDPGSSVPRECLWECEGKQILLTHGDVYHVKSGLTRLWQRAVDVGAAAVLFGHTHQQWCESRSGLLMVNPGALANHSHCRSYAVLDITAESITARHFSID